jgi:2-keto-3-deoxy-L-rhamnonate aldolase RhmA
MTSRRSIGLLTGEPSRLLLAQAVAAGMGFVVVDAEQTGVTPRECADVVATLSGSGTEVVIRVPSLDEATLVTFANTGADELLLPQVREVSEVEAAFRAVQFAPTGHRSRQVSPASRYGTDFSRPPRLSVLIETVEAAESAERFATCPWLFSAWIGPTDLADDLARRRPEGAEALPQAVKHIVTTFVEHGASIGLPAADAASARSAFERGADRVSVYWEKFVGSALRDMSAVVVR